MLTNKELLVRLRVMGLQLDEAKFYLELLKQPRTHLQISRATGIERARIYRIAERLEKRGLLTRITDDRGTFLVAADPSALEINLIEKEQQLKKQRAVLQTLVPSLSELQGLATSSSFSIKTYEGQSGFKQMCWNELKTRGEIVTFGHGNIETLTNDRHWTARHRMHQVDARYRTRDLVNQDNTDRAVLASEDLYQAKLYRAGVLPLDVLSFTASSQTVVYNDVVEIFHYEDEKRVGVEIVNLSYANMMRQLFENYWHISQEHHLTPTA